MSEHEQPTERTLPFLPPMGARYLQLVKDIEDIHDAARDAQDSAVYVEWLKQVFLSWDYHEVIEHLWLVFGDVRLIKGLNEFLKEENRTLREENEKLKRQANQIKELAGDMT
ncbi:hypothetical protein FKW77_008829 [Venturia effusa]|uniref:Uncharacterized protein n=1 Tax=Venturia effusa TaxID=50376 RepID=A0A517L9U6_9PEZI|nr:hypothetical protein FKW77_008829 [Venturia effusa]